MSIPTTPKQNPTQIKTHSVLRCKWRPKMKSFRITLMLFTNMSETAIPPCKPSGRILAIGNGAKVFISATAPMPTGHMAFEILSSVSAFKGTACHGAFEASVVYFDVFTSNIPPRQRFPLRSMRDYKVPTHLYLCRSENDLEQCGH